VSLDGRGPAKLPGAVLKSLLQLLGAILQLALESERIARNPVRMVRKVARPPRKEVRPLPPATIEAMRAVSGPRDACRRGDMGGPLQLV
jgi:hypothetical protein